MVEPRGKAAVGNDAQLEEKQVYCWACRALIVVPMQNGHYAHVFKCGWCGAINPQKPASAPWEHAAALPQSEALADTNLRGAAAGGASRCATCSRRLDILEERLARMCTCAGSRHALAAIGATVVVAIAAFICAIGMFGTYPVLYDLCDSRWSFAAHALVAASLIFSILFNYTLAVGRSPGRVSEFYDIARTPERQSLSDFTYCSKCDRPKPPHAHHCSICGFCVVDMDHHCPFLNNCVGRGNMRPFLLFLFWVMLAMVYAMIMLTVSIYKHRKTLKRAFSAAHSRRFTSSSWLPDLSLYMITVMRLPAAPFTALVLIVACTVVISAVAPLCIRHWWLALDGATFVGSLKGERIVHGSSRLENLQYVFGSSHPARWFLPSLDRAPLQHKLHKGA